MNRQLHYTLPLFLLSFLFYSTAVAQYSKKQMVAFLTNDDDHGRAWQLSDYQTTLGDECKGNGQLYTFLKDGNLTWKKCVNGKIKRKQLKWELKYVGNNDNNEWQINFSDPLEMEDGSVLQYLRVDFISPSINTKGKKMSWREFPGCKLCPTAILTLASKN